MQFNYILDALAVKTITSSFSDIIDEECKNSKSYDEKICITHRNGKQWINTFIKPAELTERLKALKLCSGNSYYISSQPLVGCAKNRQAKNQFSFANVIVDIDAHAYLNTHILPDQDWQTLLDDLTWYIKRDLGDLAPNFAVKTGRGLQCWWNFEETSKVLYFLFDSAVSNLCDVLESLICDHKKFAEVFEIDKAASKKKLALFRLPGSYNPRTKQQTKIVTIHNRRFDFNAFNMAIIDLLDAPPKQNKTKQTILYHSFGYQNLLSKRQTFIEKLVKTGQINKGRREVSVFLYFNATRQLYGQENAEWKTNKLNQMLPQSLSHSTLSTIYKNKKTYKFSNKIFTEYLQLTKHEQEEYSMKTSNLSRDITRAKAKVERNMKVCAYRKEGLSLRKISEKMDISVNTVRNILKESQH